MPELLITCLLPYQVPTPANSVLTVFAGLEQRAVTHKDPVCVLAWPLPPAPAAALISVGTTQKVYPRLAQDALDTWNPEVQRN